MGLIVLAALAAYIILSIGLMVAAHFMGKRKGWKWCKWWTVGLVMLLIPTWDILPGRLYFSYLCNTQAGMFVYETVELPEEYFLEEGEIDKSKHGSSEEGYAIASGGELNLAQLKNQYDFFEGMWKMHSKIFHIDEYERKIIRKADYKILSMQKFYSYGGGWVANLYDMSQGYSCPQYEAGASILSKTFSR